MPQAPHGCRAADADADDVGRTDVKLGGAIPCGPPGVRQMLKAFAPGAASARTLRWDAALDLEDGAGVKLALLDSGLIWSNAAFAGPRIRGRDFTGSGSLLDATGHGTASAALLVGRGDRGAQGLCPGCDLLVAKVLGQHDWKRTASAVAAAIRWAVRSGADVIVLPFGTSRGAASITREIRAAAARGCHVLAAAGNRGAERICFPAWLPDVTAVSALAKDGTPYPGSCASDDVDVFVWGDDVPAGGLGATTRLSGSSPAAVLAAGVMALRRAAQNRSHAKSDGGGSAWRCHNTRQPEQKT